MLGAAGVLEAVGMWEAVGVPEAAGVLPPPGTDPPLEPADPVPAAGAEEAAARWATECRIVFRVGSVAAGVRPDTVSRLAFTLGASPW
jgi:hypothetical protein